MTWYILGVLVNAQADARGIRIIEPLPTCGPIPLHVVGKRTKAGDQHRPPTPTRMGIKPSVTGAELDKRNQSPQSCWRNGLAP